MRTPTAIVLTAVAACLAALAPAASAKTEQAGSSTGLVGGPALGGDSVVWARGAAGAGVVVEHARPGGGPPQTLLTRTFSDYSDDETGEFASGGIAGFAASGAFALLDTTTSSGSSKYMQYVFGARTDAAPLAGGKATAVASCSGYGDYFNGGGPSQPGPPQPRSAVDGSVAVLAGCGAPVVRDLASGQVLRTLSVVGTAPRIAGGFVASLSAGKVVVRDWQADAIAYEVPVTANAAYDLDPDGTLVTVQFPGKPSCPTGTLRFHSAANPGGAESPVKPCAAVVAAEGGKAAVVTSGDGGQVVAAVGPDGSRTDLAWLGDGKRRRGAVDYVGGVVAYALKSCDGSVRILRSSAPMDRGTPTGCLRLRIASARISKGRLLVRGTTDPGFAGRLEVSYALKIGKKYRFFDRTVRAGNGAFSYSGAPPASWLRSRRAAAVGSVDISFAGDATYEQDLDSADVRTPR
jgi:hypothetical protein